MKQSIFSSLPTPKPDPLFAIGTEARLAGPEVINGTLGVFMDEDGSPLLFPSVRRAVKEIAAELPTMDFSYPALTGLESFRNAVARLLPSEVGAFMASIASTGGTGALAINLRLMRMLLPEAEAPIILPSPAWGNHAPPCRAAGLTIMETPYVLNGRASIASILETIKKVKGPFGILLQVGCHNPTGLDLSLEDWKTLSETLRERDCIALLDIAYQGFIGEPETDAGPIEMFVRAGIPTLVTWSASKNHSIYGLRVGLAVAYVPSEALAATVEGHYSSITRMLHSASSTFGQAIVARVQEQFRAEWLQDLADARSILTKKRQLLMDGLPESCTPSLKGHGMFAQLPLTVDQINRLKTEHKVYMTLDGRINIAGIPERRIGELCEKIVKVL